MKKKVINVYTCSFGHRLVTVTVDRGTLGDTTTCRECALTYQRYGIIARRSVNSYEPEALSMPTHEWYAPKYPERIPDSKTRLHCQRGGLLLRPTGDGDYTDALDPRRAYDSLLERVWRRIVRALKYH